MSRESIEWLNTNVLVGFTEKRKSPGNPNGVAWHYSEDAQGDESNHYPGAIPVDDVERRLFSFEPTLVPATYEYDGETKTSDHIFVVNDQTGEVLGCHGKDYVPHSYKQWLMENVSTILDDELQIASAALLSKGSVAFVTVEVPDNITTPEGVVFRPYLCAVTSTNGTIATTYKRCVTNWVCDNTMGAGLRENGMEYRVRHTKNSHMRLQGAKDALAIVHDIADDFSKEISQLCDTKVTDKQMGLILDQLVPVPKDDVATKEDGSTIVLNQKKITIAENKRADLMTMYNSDPRCKDWNGTAWGVLQTFNTYQNHESTVRGQTRTHKNMMAMVKGDFETHDQNVLDSIAAVCSK